MYTMGLVGVKLHRMDWRGLRAKSGLKVLRGLLALRGLKESQVLGS